MEIELDLNIIIDGTPHPFGYKIEDDKFDKDMLLVVQTAIDRMCNKVMIFLNSILEI